MEHGAYYIKITNEMMKLILTTRSSLVEVVDGIPEEAVITQTVFNEIDGCWNLYFRYGNVEEGREYIIFCPEFKRHDKTRTKKIIIETKDLCQCRKTLNEWDKEHTLGTMCHQEGNRIVLNCLKCPYLHGTELELEDSETNGRTEGEIRPLPCPLANGVLCHTCVKKKEE